MWVISRYYSASLIHIINVLRELHIRQPFPKLDLAHRAPPGLDVFVHDKKSCIYLFPHPPSDEPLALPSSWHATHEDEFAEHIKHHTAAAFCGRDWRNRLGSSGKHVWFLRPRGRPFAVAEIAVNYQLEERF